jgi:hypothetical protein
MASNLPPDGSRPLAVVDIDGVVADVRHRLQYVERKPKDWDAFFGAAPHDPPHAEGVDLVTSLGETHEVVFLTGRPEKTRGDTETWLAAQGLGGHPVFMRPGGDRRPAAKVKVELLRELARGREVGVVVDDDPYVIEAMRAAGFNVHAAEWERRLLDEQDADALIEAQEVEGRT